MIQRQIQLGINYYYSKSLKMKNGHFFFEILKFLRVSNKKTYVYMDIRILNYKIMGFNKQKYHLIYHFYR